MQNEIDRNHDCETNWVFSFVYSCCLQDWSIKYNQDEPVAPRYEVNAPDLYIPGMVILKSSINGL